MQIHRVAFVFCLLFGAPWFAASGGNVASAQSLAQKEEPQHEQTIQQPVTFKRVKLTLKSGEEIKLKDAVWDNGLLRGRLIMKRKSDWRKYVAGSYQSDDIQSFKYSNTRAGGKGAIRGAFLGLASPFLFGGIAIIINNKVSGHIPVNYIDETDALVAGPPPAAIIAIIFLLPATLGAGIGYLIGSQMYTDWQEYDLTGLNAHRIVSLSFAPNNGVKMNFTMPLFR